MAIAPDYYRKYSGSTGICSHMAPILRRIWRDESGQDLIEYALMASLAAIVALSVPKQAITDLLSTCYSRVADGLKSAGGG